MLRSICNFNWILTEKYTCRKVKRPASLTMGVLESPLPLVKFSLVSIVCTGREDDQLPWVKDAMLNSILTYAFCTSPLNKVKFSVTLSIVVTCHCEDQFTFTASKPPFIPFCCHSTSQHNSFIECSQVPRGHLRLSGQLCNKMQSD